MSQFAFETAAAARIAHLFTFTWGPVSPPTVNRYTDWNSEITVISLFSAHPEITFDAGRSTMGVEDEPWDITMPRRLQPATRLARGPYRGDIEVRIERLDPANTSERRSIFRGIVRTAFTNVGGNPNVVRLSCDSIKQRLQREVGLVASVTDNYWLGHAANGVNVATLRSTGVVDSVEVGGKPARVRLTFDTLPSLDDAIWRGGWLDIDGERVRVRKSVGFVGGTQADFDLGGKPDSSWPGMAFTLTQGYDGSAGRATTLGIFPRFGAFGFAMPSRNPIFQSGSQA